MSTPPPNKFTFFIALSVLITGSLFTGCASITKGNKDTLHVEITNCSEPVECVATNKKGEWKFKAPGPVTFKKSDDQLVIACKDGEEVLTRSVKPTRGAMAWGNVIFGGIIGGAVDASLDSHWDMVDSVLLHRKTCRGKEIAN